MSNENNEIDNFRRKLFERGISDVTTDALWDLNKKFQYIHSFELEPVALNKINRVKAPAKEIMESIPGEKYLFLYIYTEGREITINEMDDVVQSFRIESYDNDITFQIGFKDKDEGQNIELLNVYGLMFYKPHAS